jgi:hypothetical protein
MRGRNSHQPNEEVDAPPLAFHLVRFVRLLFAFCLQRRSGRAALQRWIAGSLGRLGWPLEQGRRWRGATTGECSRRIQRLGAE